MKLPSTKNLVTVSVIAGGVALSVAACDGGHYHTHTIVHRHVVVHPAPRRVVVNRRITVPRTVSRPVVVGRRR